VTAIAGVLRLDGGPLERARLEALATPAPGNVVDALAMWVEGPIGLSSAIARTTPESAHEAQPLVDPGSGCVIVFDGRLDNRSDLRAKLQGHPRLLAEESDAAYALAAYVEWGVDAPHRLLGDFALAVWDPRARRLLLANDPMAMRPIYYSTWSDRLAFASTLEQLLGDPDLPRDLDEPSVLRYLYPNDAELTSQTYYRHVQLLPGGHTLVSEPPRVELRRYWQWPEEPPAPRRASQADVDEFRALFEETVRCRLRSPTPVGLSLSGGLDSGAIASVAGALSQRGEVAPIRAYSFVFDEYTVCDERAYSQAASARYQFPHACVPADDCWTLSRFEEWLPVFNDPHFGAYEDAWYKILGRARADGVRVMMTGDGGDFVAAGSPFYFSDWLLQGRWSALYSEVRARARRPGQSLAGAVAPAVTALLPVAVQRRVGTVAMPQLDAWIPFRLRQQRHHAHMSAPLFRGRAAWWYQLRKLIGQFAHGYHNAFKDRQLRRFGMEVRQPFFDVRLMQYALRTPPDAFYRNATTKVVMREALRDILPPVIRDRRDKANFNPLAQLGLRERRRTFIESLLEDSELERRGYVVPAAWKQYYRDYVQNGGPAYWAFWRTLTTEMWLRRQTGRLPPLR
jgi:asparagine synthase (glutamine-hydrolysing)